MLRRRDCPGNMVAGGPPAIFGPALLSNQRHEHDAAEILFVEIGLAATGEFQQCLLFFPPRPPE